MKKFTPILIFLFCMATAKSQEPAITMTTAKAVGDTISFGLSADTINTVIQVDFGDGTKVDEPIDAREIEFPVPFWVRRLLKRMDQGFNLFIAILSSSQPWM